jgi:alpha 1,2-mannosyltransferase
MSPLGSLKEHLELPRNTTVVFGQNSISNFAADPETLVTNPNASVQQSTERRANATFVFLARNNDLEGVVDTIRQMEDRFNHKYQYPWVLLNEVPFTNDFKRSACSTAWSWALIYGLLPDVFVS